VSTTWTKVSGPGTVSFSSPNALTTTATFSAAGTYVVRLSASDSSLTSTDDATVVVSPAPLPGLTGQYFNDSGGTHLGTVVLTRTDNNVNFAWTGSPGTGVNSDNFSVRWTGFVQAPVAGSFRFSTQSNDGIRLWINGQLVINNWTNHSVTTDTSAPITLAAGVKYSLVLEYYDRTGTATAKLQWSYPGQSTQIIPASRLFRQ
jgi:hypothetical protein